MKIKIKKMEWLKFLWFIINTLINDIKIILEEIFNVLKKEELSKKEINIVFQKIAKKYYWGNNNNNHNFDSFLKYIDLLHLLIGGKDLKEPKRLNEGNALNFQLFLIII